jgi:cell division protein FtsI (penicillin-binding protein 3)
VVADQRAVVDPARTARQLARLVDVDPAVLYDRLNGDSAFSYLARQVEEEVAAAVEEAGFDGVWTIDEPLRQHSSGDLALSVLGITDPDGQGISGLELAYEDTLAGEDGLMRVERDTEGRTIPAGRQEVTPASRGDDLILTLDSNLQFRVEQTLADHIEASGARAGSVIVSEPGTGEILALVNLEWDAAAGEVVASGHNVALVNTYEPGSVLKALVMAAGLETGVVSPAGTYDVPPYVDRGGHRFREERCTEPRPYRAAEILAHSCNVGTIQIAEDIGPADFYDYLMAFGFDGPTGLDFPDEASATVPDPGSWSGSSLASMSLGQGIAISPMQLLFAYNTIANDGLYVPPTLVSSVVDEDGVRHPVEEGAPRRVVSTAAAREVQGMMVDVVTEGTGSPAAIEGYEVAGKTGTARKPNPEGGYEWPDGYRYMVSFAGFLPVADPQLSVLVLLDEPEGSSASATAAPVFADVAQEAVHQLGIPPAA